MNEICTCTFCVHAVTMRSLGATMSEQLTTIEPSIRNPVAAVFNLDDEAERFMVGVMQRFHGPERLYRAHALKRTKNATGRVVVEIASFNPPRHARTYLLIFWEIDEVAIRFKDCASMQDARAAFNVA